MGNEKEIYDVASALPSGGGEFDDTAASAKVSLSSGIGTKPPKDGSGANCQKICSLVADETQRLSPLLPSEVPMLQGRGSLKF